MAESVSRIGNDMQKVKIEVVNPKTLTQGQLVGHLEPISREWTDGIVARTLRLIFILPVKMFLVFEISTIIRFVLYTFE